MPVQTEGMQMPKTHFGQLNKRSLCHFEIDERLTFLEEGTAKVETDVNDGILNRGPI